MDRYYASLIERIDNADSKKMLKYIERAAGSYLRDFNKYSSNNSAKKALRKEHKQIIKRIKTRSKQLN